MCATLFNVDVVFHRWTAAWPESEDTEDTKRRRGIHKVWRHTSPTAKADKKRIKMVDRHENGK